ncbi:T-cell surface antigen CD2-like [Limanda limanda]|uniref:T-cell surface antigen CD2-like n=1 Tax=Limanda limanda TaxID=27771 RepID=UPI0029C8A93B|nr:T-cell surface antigen CD2-like [Limanda limanda]
MACFAVIILSGFISISAAKETCDRYAAVGQSRTLTLDFKGLENKNALKWSHNNKTLFLRDGRGNVSVGKKGDVSATGSLELKNLQFSDAGVYEGEVQSFKRPLPKTWRVCVMDKVSKPQLTYVCDLKSSTVNLNCNVSRPQDLDFSWMLNDKSLTGGRQTLGVPIPLLKEQRSFTCSVANRVSKERSDAVRPTCPSMLCLSPKTVVAAVAGGVSLILFLIVIIVVLCFYYRCNKTQNGLREKWVIRMLSLNMLERDSISPDYETMNPAENPPPPSPKPIPRACYQNVPPPEAQPGNGPVQLSNIAERQQPSPVPKPRTKTTNIGMFLPQ